MRTWHSYNIQFEKVFSESQKKCFLCLRDGNVLRNYTQSFTCFKCQGKRHISIFEEKKRIRDHSSKSIQKQSPSTVEIETQTNLSDISCNVLHQTTVANLYVSKKSEIKLFFYYLIAVLSLVV